MNHHFCLRHQSSYMLCCHVYSHFPQLRSVFPSHCHSEKYKRPVIAISNTITSLNDRSLKLSSKATELTFAAHIAQSVDNHGFRDWLQLSTPGANRIDSCYHVKTLQRRLCSCRSLKIPIAVATVHRGKSSLVECFGGKHIRRIHSP